MPGVPKSRRKRAGRKRVKSGKRKGQFAKRQ